MKNDVYEWNEKHLNTHFSECFLFYLKVKLGGLFLKLLKSKFIEVKKKEDVCERNEKKTNYLFNRMFFFYLRARVFIIIF